MIRLRSRPLPFLALLLLVVAADAVAGKPGMTWRDLVQVRKVETPILSDDGSWIAVEARPDRGDGEVLFCSADGRRKWLVPRGTVPRLASDGGWGAALEQPDFATRDQTEKPDTLRSVAVLMDLRSGATLRFASAQTVAFSADGQWCTIHAQAAPEPADQDEESDDQPRTAGTNLTLVRLKDHAQFDYADVARVAWSESSARLALVQETATGLGNRSMVLDCTGNDPAAREVAAADSASWQSLAWAEELPLLALIQADTRDPDKPVAMALLEYDGTDGSVSTRLTEDAVGVGWTLPLDNALRYSRDGARLFLGLREAKPEAEPAPDAEDAAPFDILDVDAILAKREVDVWHYQDPRIKTHERKSFKERQEHRYLGVLHRGTGQFLRLSDPALETVQVPDEGTIALAFDPTPWLREMTWDGAYQDVWTVNMATGERTRVVERVQDTVSRSPLGRYIVWFLDGDFYLHDTSSGESRNLTAGLGVPFTDEDHDYPRTAPDYGVAGWLRDESAVLLNDKYDLWRVPTDGSAATNLTRGQGRAQRRTYRVVDLREGPKGFDPAAELLLTGFDELAKNSSIWTLDLAGGALERRREAERYYDLRARAKHADRYLYSEESYDLFNDLWVANGDFTRTRQLTDLNPQLRDFDPGQAELVDWLSEDGTPLQGILIKPAGYEEGKRYPVFVYYYRFFSPLLHRFPDPVLNHRPKLYAYTGDGYAVFLPDIRFTVGQPGHSAAGSLIPGVQKIIEMGVADPGAIALHGHSWSGYQTAQIITGTDIFACAVAGAPVSNMTSAYGGIRYGTGLSRQFQYEKEQSRIGATLWERRDLYIENSPLFFADRIHTPLLIEFGDEDEAVPWTQGIELYMAMRRLNKPCVLLQYRGEPHHLKKYPNKLDYTLKMKEFVDHFCKGAPAPEWWTDGVAFEGD